MFGASLFSAQKAWEHSLRRQFIREGFLPPLIKKKLLTQYPHLSEADAALVIKGLRQFFMAYSRSGRRFVGMPSRVVDEAWHTFILSTSQYQAWCKTAFGHHLDHTPAEALRQRSQMTDGLKRTWYWTCTEEAIFPRQPSRLPLLFALDSKLQIPEGYHYVLERDFKHQEGGQPRYYASDLNKLVPNDIPNPNRRTSSTSDSDVYYYQTDTSSNDYSSNVGIDCSSDTSDTSSDSCSDSGSDAGSCGGGCGGGGD